MTELYWLLGAVLALLCAVIVILIKNKKPDFTPEEALSRLKEGMEAASFKTLSEQSKLGEQALESKKKLIDSAVEEMRAELERIKNSLNEFDRSSRVGFEAVSQQVRLNTETASRLNEATAGLKEVLKSTKARGQWGERMAEDILTTAGLLENVNYLKQKQTGSGTTPDFTFLLPQNLKANMDVKFPFENYMAFLEAKSESDKETAKKKFLSDVRDKIKQVTTRDYINTAEGTVDYVILFIPNEQVYAFINECDGQITAEALKKKVIMCSPLTLYPMLVLIRQAHENFKMEKNAREMINAMENFERQWSMFISAFDKLGAKIADAQEEYDNLLSTRKNQLERSLKEVALKRGKPGEEN